MADAAHVLSDVASFVLSAYAIWLSAKPGCSRMSFGHGRMEVMVALVSILMIWIVTAALLNEAIHRLVYPEYDLNPHVMTQLLSYCFLDYSCYWYIWTDIKRCINAYPRRPFAWP